MPPTEKTHTAEAKQLARVIKKRGLFDLVTSSGQLISGGYCREQDAISTAHRLGYDVEGHNSTPARKAYDRHFTGFNPSGFGSFKVGYDAAVEDQATTHAQMRRALEKIEKNLSIMAPDGDARALARSALALPPMEGSK